MTDLLSGAGFIMYSKQAARLLGVNAAILLGELCAKHQYWLEAGRLEQEGWFFCTREDIEADTALSAFQQREAVRVLVGCGVLDCRNHGVPSRRFYRINRQVLYNMMQRNWTSCSQETEEQDVKKLETTKKETKKETKNTQTSVGRPRDVEEVAAYCRERQSCVDPVRFFEYYTSNGWRVGRQPMRDWRAAVRHWETNEGGRENGTDRSAAEAAGGNRPQYGDVL